jgi:hypothetical protein
MRTLLVGLVLVLFGAASSEAVAVPILTATAGPTSSNFVGGCIVNSAGGSGSTPQAADIVCGDTFGNNQGKSAASIGHVGALARAVSFSGQISNNTGHATYADTVIFSPTSGTGTGPILVSMNVLFSGLVNAATGEDIAQAGMFVAIDGTKVGSVNNNTGGTCVSTFAGSLGCGATTSGGLTTGLIQVPVGGEVTFLFDLFVSAGASRNPVAPL